MEIMLRARTGAPGETTRFPDDIDTPYDLFGIQEAGLVEKLSPYPIEYLTPAENPYKVIGAPERSTHTQLTNTIVDDDEEEDDVDEDIDELDMEDEDVEDATDDDIDDDLDLDLDEEEDDEDDIV